MLNIVELLHQYSEFFPIAAIAALFLAGLNVPFSEDLIIITGALLCRGEQTLLLPTFAALYFGVTISDYFPYYIGKALRRGSIKIRFLEDFFLSQKLEKMHGNLEKYGIFTFIVCRFIPFGVRNTLFMTSGFFRLKLKKFAIYEITAATISVSTLFFLTYHFGEMIEKPFHAVGIALFIMLVSMVTIIIISITRQIIRKRKTAV